ncbi:uncharacterized protein A4U43_C07F10290 [Asparagus officinalis]|uniref:Uncharacterized protein n=1 Tax=Asparagus officinalis TaxID=4686 RepID=A0A5P1EAZ7_ASPOF|nr:uncharacterized protein LOC109850674 [Asparagus officinalis]ONK62994.1 uncharacterized protein A4U43_C07F10290 [Asparagus officinalis]
MSDRRESIQETEDTDDDDQIQQEQQQQQQPKKKKKKEEKESRNGFERKLSGVKNLVMRPLIKFEKVCTRKKRRPPPAPFPYSEDFGKGCHPHLCFVQPRVDDSPPLRPNPDRKTSSYHDFLRNFIESNDFYSPECNVHRGK